MMLGIPRTGMYSMTDMLMMLGYFGPVNQILQEEYITIVKNP
jgi:hypothetical protein